MSCSKRTCPLCGGKYLKSALRTHLIDSHSDFIEEEVAKVEDEKNYELIKENLITRLVDGHLDFELCPSCGKPVYGRDPVSHLRRCTWCGCKPRVFYHQNSMREWKKTEDGRAWLESFHEAAIRNGNTVGKKNLENYVKSDLGRLEASERGKIYGKINGPKNITKYNTEDEYHEIRSNTAKRSAQTRELSPEYQIKRALIGSFNTDKRKFGEADLYIFKTVDPAKGYKICKVGYSRDFFKFRIHAYNDFEISNVLICHLEASKVLEFEQECMTKFNHYWIHHGGQIGKSEWYWENEFDKIIDLAKEKGYNFSSYDL